MAIRNYPRWRCHLEFIRIENSAIRSAVPENPTLEPNMKWIGSPAAEIWPFAYVGGIWNPHFGGRGMLLARTHVICHVAMHRTVGVDDGTIRKSDGSFL